MGSLSCLVPSEPHNFAIQMKEFVDSVIEDREPLTSGEKIMTQLKDY